MSILVDKNTRLVVQGITGSAGAYHTRQCMDYGTNVVAGVTPGKGGQMFDGRVPVFDTVWEARQKTDCNASMVFVPAPAAADSILEAVNAGVELVVCITEGIPVMDMMRVKALMREKQSRLIGPNCPGIITPGACKIGIMPGYIHKPGKIGVISRSGTLTYEAVWQLTSRGYGQSTCIGIGGDPIGGLSHLDCMKLFNEDPGTDAIILIGEIGGSAEEEAAEWIKKNCRKPVAAFIAGMTAPPGRRMGHAGAIVSGGKGTAAGKIEALKAASIAVAETPAAIADTLIARYESVILRPSSFSLSSSFKTEIAYEYTCPHRYYLDREGIPIFWTGLELPHGPWFHWERSFLDAFPRPMARLRTTGRKRYPSVVLVLEHCRKHTHVCLLYFPTRSGWDSRVSPKLTDLHPQLNADSEAQVRFHCRGAFATPARDGIGAAVADFEAG